MYCPESEEKDCPDAEACQTGFPCYVVRYIAAVTEAGHTPDPEVLAAIKQGDTTAAITATINAMATVATHQAMAEAEAQPAVGVPMYADPLPDYMPVVWSATETAETACAYCLRPHDSGLNHMATCVEFIRGAGLAVPLRVFPYGRHVETAQAHYRMHPDSKTFRMVVAWLKAGTDIRKRGL